MRFFQVNYRALDKRRRRTGKRCKTETWYIEFTDNLQQRRRISSTCKDRKSAEAVGRKIDRLVRYKANNDPLDPELSKWLRKRPPKFLARLVEFGLVEPATMIGLQPLQLHLDGQADSPGWRQVLTAKGRTARYVRKRCERARLVMEGCRFKYWRDVDASQVLVYLDGLRAGSLDAQGGRKAGIGAQTFNYYLGAFKAFCRWMVQERGASENRILHEKPLEAAKVRSDRRYVRRALSVEEVRCLLETTRGEPERFGMTGPERAMLYRLAIESGLRAAELASLTRASFDLATASPTVVVLGAYAKGRRDDVLPLRADTAGELSRLLRHKMPETAAFNLPTRTAKMLRADLAAARDAWLEHMTIAEDRRAAERSSFLADRDGLGRVADFHALRHTCGTLLAATGVHPKVAQTIMRHSTIELTMKYYTHVLAGQEADAVAGLPDLGIAAEQAVVATGTDDR